MQEAFTSLLTMGDRFHFFFIVGIYFSLLMAKLLFCMRILFVFCFLFVSQNCVAPNTFGWCFVSVAVLVKQAADLALVWEHHWGMKDESGFLSSSHNFRSHFVPGVGVI